MIRGGGFYRGFERNGDLISIILLWLHPINVSAMHGCMELTENSVRQVERVHSSWIQIEAAGQDTGLLDLCGDDIEFRPPDSPPIIGRAAIKAWLRGGAKDKIQRIETSDLRVRGSDEIAYLTASYKTTFSAANNQKPRQTGGSHLWVLQNRTGKWLISLVSWSHWD